MYFSGLINLNRFCSNLTSLKIYPYYAWLGQAQSSTEPPAPAPGFGGTQVFLLRTLVRKRLKTFHHSQKKKPCPSRTHSNSSPPRSSGERIIIPSHLHRSLPFYSRVRVWASRSLTGKSGGWKTEGFPTHIIPIPPTSSPRLPDTLGFILTERL